jgi:hypothetical protein
MAEELRNSMFTYSAVASSHILLYRERERERERVQRGLYARVLLE